MNTTRDRGKTAELLARFDRPGPRYTSYPTAVDFSEGFPESMYRSHLEAANQLEDAPLSLYAHLPFCEERCLFCGCHVVRTKRYDVARRYLDYLSREIAMLAETLPERRELSQLHFGGGTPTYYAASELEALVGSITKHFHFTRNAEIGIEVDPRVTRAEQTARLAELGFNRISLGVQDFTPEVQEAIGRVQSFELTADLIAAARGQGYRSVNLDLIYGLPFQTEQGFRNTLDQVLELRPDRIAVYSFAYVPWLKAHQERMPIDALPPAEVKIEILGLAIDVLTAAGYRQIGMDHFALPGDELATAVDERALGRNFMGYTVQKTGDLLGVGISAIGDVQGAFVQNVKKLSQYYAAIDAGRFPVEKGLELDFDDTVRRYVITQIMCNGSLDRGKVERRFDIDFAEYFERELCELTGPDSPVEHGLLAVGEDALELTECGKLFVRNVAMAFDERSRRRSSTSGPVFSRTV